MKRRLVALFGFALLLLITPGVAKAEEYIVTITVDGKPVTLAASTAGGVLVIQPNAAGVQVLAVEKVAPAAPAAPASAAQYQVNRNANLRSGPGTTFAVVGSARLGDRVTVINQSAAGDWYQLGNGQWIAAFLLDAVTAGEAPPAPASAAPTPLPPTATPAPPPTPQPQAQNCDPSYPTLCLPPNSPDLDCGDIGARRFQVLPPDPHRFDGDRDGVGCES